MFKKLFLLKIKTICELILTANFRDFLRTTHEKQPCRMAVKKNFSLKFGFYNSSQHPWKVYMCETVQIILKLHTVGLQIY